MSPFGGGGGGGGRGLKRRWAVHDPVVSLAPDGAADALRGVSHRVKREELVLPEVMSHSPKIGHTIGSQAPISTR